MFKPTKKQHLINKNYADKNGGSGGSIEPLIVRYDHTEVSGNTYTHYFDKTWQEVANALTNFTPVYMHGFTAEPEYSEIPLMVLNAQEAYPKDEDFEHFTVLIGDDPLIADSADGVLHVIKEVRPALS